MMIFAVFSNKNGLLAGGVADCDKTPLVEVENYDFCSVFKQERSACGGVVACDKTSLYAMVWACGC